jgi:phage-related protein
MRSDESGEWIVDIPNPIRVSNGLKGISPEMQLIILDKFRLDLNVNGMNMFALEKAKWLGVGLAEYRFRKDPELLVRLFFFFSGKRVVVVLSAYNKKSDPSRNRQQREIAKAKALMSKHR